MKGLHSGPLLPHHGVLTLSGYGISVRVERGHLVYEDGVGSIRHKGRLARVRHGLQRLVIVGNDGAVSLAALRWLADQDAAFVMLERNGTVLATTGPVRASDAHLRRSQALAPQSGKAVTIARVLIERKLSGQEWVARNPLSNSSAADVIAQCRAGLRKASTLDTIRLLESRGASAYWSCWRALPIVFPTKDIQRVPDHWREFGARVSPLSSSPRYAVNPANAMLNYLYAMLEAEARLAAATRGLDPGLGFLHLDKQGRDSLASDLMEVVRPEVDACVLNWISSQPLRREWFFEQRDGSCRLMAEFAAQLAESAPAWAKSLAPVVDYVIRALLASASSARSEIVFQSSNWKARSAAHQATLKPQRLCPSCGSNVNPESRLCYHCSVNWSTEGLMEAARRGRAAAHTSKAQERRSKTQSRQEAARRGWLAAKHPAWLDEKFYRTQILPRLATIPYRTIAARIGVCEPYAAGIRAGRRLPHPRHWEVLAKLTGVADSAHS